MGDARGKEKVFTSIKKRDGRVELFDPEKITRAISKAGAATGEFGDKIAQKLTLKVLNLAQQAIPREIPTVEEIQDVVEEVLLSSPYRKTAKAYIIYREQHAGIREITAKADVDLVDQYLERIDWQVNENSNMSFSLQGLNNYVSSEISKIYWMRKIYPPEVRQAHSGGDFHIHDLNLLSVYCVGWDLFDLLVEGFKGAQGKIESKPAKHLRSALGQIVNFFYTLQGEAAGAQAFSNFDTLLAPFIRYDGLSYKEVKQALQEFVFNINVPTRVGFQTPFTNITLDLTVPEYYANQGVIRGGELQKETYREFQPEMDLFNKAFLEVMAEGDAKGRVFTFPIPTYNITKDFDWGNPNLDVLWQVTAKYGVPYFSNFINSDMNPEDARSMCCRLRIDNRQLEKRGGGLFGSSPLTGCYDEKTEILTEDGWKIFKDLKIEDNVFTLTKDNQIELHQPSRLFEYDYEGELIRFKARSFDLLVTPNHRMVVDHAYKNKRTFVKAEEFNPFQHLIPKGGIWEGKEQEYFELPPVIILQGAGAESSFSEEEIEEIQKKKREGKSIYQIAQNFDCNPATIYNVYTKENYGNRQRTRIRYEAPSLKIKMDDWLKFFGFWTAEGSTDNEKNALDHGYRVVITQSNKQKREEITEVLDKLPFNYYIDEDNIVICNKQLWNYLRPFGNKYTKFIPKEIKNLSKRQLGILFDWMVKGDGHIRKSTGQINYWTASKRLADDLQEIILKLGWMGTAAHQKAKTSEIKGRKIKAGIVYNIGVQKTKHYRFREENLSQVFYKGKVYCCEVPNHTVFVRRNGKVSWCGNSIGVVTLNMPRLGYLAKDEDEFISALERLMTLARESLEVKRKVLEHFTEESLYPYTRYYLRGVKERFGEYWKNHFSTIGLVGMNEACLNMFGEPIASEKSREFTSRVLDFMRDKLLKFQAETGNNYNLEATPAEGTSYRLAKKDKEKYPEIICANEAEWKRGAEPFYTNSTQLPVNYTEDVFEALDLQDEIQTKYTGGCLEEGNKVLTDKGLLKIEEIVKDFTALKPIKALSYNPEEGISEWDEITDAITVNLKRQNKIRVKGERGLDIVTSDWHPFFILEKVKPNPVCPVCGCGVKNIKSFATHLRWNPECRIKYRAMPKYRVVERRADELKVGDYILQNSCNLYPERGTKLNPDLMWLIGFFIGDGSVSEFVDNRGGNNLKKYKVRFSSEQQAALRKAAKILNKYFGCKVKVIQNDKRSEALREVTTSKKEVTSFFFKLGFTSGKKVYNISIPKEVKDEISSDNVYSLLSGLGDSDGHIGRRDGDFEYPTVSSKLAEDILEICTRAGIMVSKGKKKARRKNEVDTFRLRIPQYQMTKIKNQLSITVNKSRIKRVLPNRKKRYLPVVRVKEVSKEEVKDNQFYDLTTQKNHNYLAGKNTLIFVHNTVFHVFAGERVEDSMTVKTLVRRICELYHLPYFTFTPTFSVCPTHGYIAGEHYTCPECGVETEVYSRVVGYLRPVTQWNKGKREEFKLRKTFAVEAEAVQKLKEREKRKAAMALKPSRIKAKAKAKAKRKYAGKQLDLMDFGGG